MACRSPVVVLGLVVDDDVLLFGEVVVPVGLVCAVGEDRPLTQALQESPVDLEGKVDIGLPTDAYLLLVSGKLLQVGLQEVDLHGVQHLEVVHVPLGTELGGKLDLRVVVSQEGGDRPPRNEHHAWSLGNPRKFRTHDLPVHQLRHPGIGQTLAKGNRRHRDRQRGKKRQE